MKLINNNNGVELLKGKYFRVHSVSKITGIQDGKIFIDSLPISDELGIEQKLKGGTYAVMVFVKSDKNNNSIFLDASIDTFLNSLREMQETIKDPIELNAALEELFATIDFAKNALMEMNESDAEVCDA